MSEQAQFGFAFDLQEAAPVSKAVEKPKRVDPLACPRCGGPSQKSIRPVEMGGERYCPVCQGADGCFYFTPVGHRPVKDSDPNLDDSGMAITEPQESVALATEIPSHVELEKNGQIPLINIGEWWEEHWKGMPEFVQKDQAPWKTVYVHFENREDMEKFSALVGQKVGLNTRSIWYPEAEIGRFAGKRYIDAEPEREVEGIETFEDEE